MGLENELFKSLYFSKQNCWDFGISNKLSTKFCSNKEIVLIELHIFKIMSKKIPSMVAEIIKSQKYLVIFLQIYVY